MKDKLFWIALIFAGFYLFNKMNAGNNKTSAPDDRIERQSDRGIDRKQRPQEIEPNFGDKDKPLNLPKKDGQVSYQENNHNDYSNRNQDLPSTKPNLGSGEKDISLGEYGSIKLPKKDGGSVYTNNDVNNQNSNTSSRNSTNSSEKMLVKLDPKTAIGEGTLDNVNGASRVVFDGKSFEVSSSANLNIYIDSGGFSAVTDCSNSTIYVKSSGQLMVSGNGRNNTIYYESGASIRNGLPENQNNRFVQVREIEYD